MGQYRHEIKYIISKEIAEILKNRLSLIMDIDKNSTSDNTYFIRSLYFDDTNNTALFEKLDGIEYRKKYRIRIYNYDDSFIRLECKHKHNNMTLKDQVTISKEDYINIEKNDLDKINTSNKLFNDFILDIKLKGLKPSVIVDYKRLAFTYPVSDVRITFDSCISSCTYNSNLFDKDSNNLSIINDNEVILEVKYNEILPESIAIILSTVPMIREAFSKFAYCRVIRE